MGARLGRAFAIHIHIHRGVGTTPTEIQSKTEYIQTLATEYNIPKRANYILEVERKFRIVGTVGLKNEKTDVYHARGEVGYSFTPLSSAHIPN